MEKNLCLWKCSSIIEVIFFVKQKQMRLGFDKNIFALRKFNIIFILVKIIVARILQNN